MNRKQTIRAQSAVIQVGNGGRGFVVQGPRGPLVITAAHCLPNNLPETHPAALYYEWTFKLLAPLGGQPDVAAECLFVNLVSDIAVLGTPDEYDQAEQYHSLLERVAPLPIADIRDKAPAWMISLDSRLFRCVVESIGHALWISDSAESIRGGMSGSPIVADDGSAIGVLCCSSHQGKSNVSTESGPNPQLALNLPGWLLRDLKVRKSKVALRSALFSHQ
jgi:hypothetical protein